MQDVSLLHGGVTHHLIQYGVGLLFSLATRPIVSLSQDDGQTNYCYASALPSTWVVTGTMAPEAALGDVEWKPLLSSLFWHVLGTACSAEMYCLVPV